MYDVNRYEKKVKGIVEDLQKTLEENKIDGLLVIKFLKAKQPEAEVNMALGSPSQFEWVGILDYAKDIIKHIASEET